MNKLACKLISKWQSYLPRSFSRNIKRMKKNKIFTKIERSDAKGVSRNKVSIVGIGRVGITTAYAIAMRGNCSNICLYDTNKKLIEAEMYDMQHGEQYLEGVQIYGGTELSVTKNSEVIVITSGIRSSEENLKLNLIQKNVEIYKEIIPPLVEQSPKAIFVIVTNPVDVMTYAAWKISKLPVNRVFGTGCILDSARLRHFIGKKIFVSPVNVHGYMIGEHGASSIPLWSSVNIAGMRLTDKYPKAGTKDDLDKFRLLHKQVVQSGYEIEKLKGTTNFGIGTATSFLVDVILNNKLMVLPVSTLTKGLYGISQDIFMSVPCLLSAKGITHVVSLKLTNEEQSAIQRSANSLHELQEKIKW